MLKHIQRRITAASGVAAVLLFVIAAAPGANEKAQELVRAGNEAYLRNDFAAADALYKQAEERTTDPGLVAFNRASVQFQMGNFREAEINYVRVLDDQAAPPERRARAWYNRGVCLLHRGGGLEFRSAIESFERCLDVVPQSDSVLIADARHNLELAKLRWLQARATSKEPQPPPNAPPKDSPPETPTKPNTGKDPKHPDDGPNTPGNTRPEKNPAGRPVTPPTPGQTPTPTNEKAAGKGNLPVLIDSAEKLNIAEEDAREYLRRLAERLQTNRRSAAAPGPERPNVLDW